MTYSLSITIDHASCLRHRHWMSYALALAEAAGTAGEVPVGAVITDKDGQLIAEAANQKERNFDPTAHAEILAIRQASQILQSWHLDDCTLYTTLEPCPMCAGAIIQARFALLVYGADDPKTGCIRTAMNIPDSGVSNHRLPVIAGILEADCRKQLQAWFAQRRENATS